MHAAVLVAFRIGDDFYYKLIVEIIAALCALAGWPLPKAIIKRSRSSRPTDEKELSGQIKKRQMHLILIIILFKYISQEWPKAKNRSRYGLFSKN